MGIKNLKNYIDGEWIESKSKELLDVRNPVTDEVIAHVPLSTAEEVGETARAAQEAFQDWRETTPYTRARYMFRLKNLMEERFEDLAQIIVCEHGKILDEARGEVRRGIENVEVAAGVPSLMMGYNMEDVSQGIDEDCVYQLYPNVAPPVAPPEDTIDLDGGGASGSVTYNAGANIAHPTADAHGQGTGTINTAKVTTSFRFAFNPTSNGTYCIYPLVYMNGHWLVWTWGTCGGTAEDLGSGEVKVMVRIKVTQLDQKLKEREHVVIHKNVSAGQDQHSGFAYDSDVDGGTATTVYLQGGYTAVVWVECECFAQISNHGRAWVDMQSSPSFYFKAGQIRWGWRICYPWWITKVKLIE